MFECNHPGRPRVKGTPVPSGGLDSAPQSLDSRRTGLTSGERESTGYPDLASLLLTVAITLLSRWIPPRLFHSQAKISDVTLSGIPIPQRPHKVP